MWDPKSAKDPDICYCLVEMQLILCHDKASSSHAAAQRKRGGRGQNKTHWADLKITAAKRYFLLHPRHSFLLTAKYSQQTETCLSPQHQFKLLTWQKTSKFGLASGQTKPCSQTKPEHRQGRGHNWGYKQGLRFQWSFNTRKLLGQFKRDTVTFLTPPSAEVQAEKYPATRSA